MSCRDFRTSAPLEWGAEPDLRDAAAEALERSVELREQVQALAGRVSAALGVAWRPALLAAQPLPAAWLERVPAVHVELLEQFLDRPAGVVLCRRGPGSSAYVARPADLRADGNGEAYEAGVTCRACLKALPGLLE